MPAPYQPIFEATRGRISESLQFGAVAVVDSHGRLLASLGDPQVVTFLRSTAKPFQAMPFIEREGQETYHFNNSEIALMCASHSGTDEHVAAVQGMHQKASLHLEDLQCGAHYPYHEATADAMKVRGETPNAFRHNCSGKHTGMLAHAKMRGLPTGSYLEVDHPVQQEILQTFAEMCDLPPAQVELGIDGCSAPNFASPIFHAALGYARLCDPFGLSASRTKACQVITHAMTSHPEMVGGPGRFDTKLMELGKGRILVKGGAEGYQGIGLLPDALGAGSPGVGIAIKISDGDPTGRARHAVSLAILNSLGAISESDPLTLAEFGPVKTLTNFRKLVIGESRPTFSLPPIKVEHD